MIKVDVNSGKSNAITDIAYVEKKYNAKFVGQFPLTTKDGCWSDSPADVYYQETPPVKGYSKYFGLIIQQGSLYIVSADILENKKFTGVIAENFEILYSRYRRDYRTSGDGSVFIDGGFDYTRTNSENTIVLKVIDGEFYDVTGEKE